MGLDNGILLKTHNKINMDDWEIIPDYITVEFDEFYTNEYKDGYYYEVCYWRKYWGLRNDVMRDLGFKDKGGGHYEIEKIDDLKEDNKRMEDKIDDIKNCLNKLVVKSKSDDDKLERRLVAIETEQKVIKELTEKNRADFNVKLTIITVLFGAISLFLGLYSFIAHL